MILRLSILKKMYKLFLTLVICSSFSVIALSVIAYAEETNNPFIVVEEIRGDAIIIDNDIVAAENVATINARIAAIEKAVGVKIESGSVMIDSMIVDYWAESFSKGVVSVYSIRKKSVNEEDGILSVWIDAVIKRALLPKKGEKWWEEIKSNYSIMVSLDEKWQPVEGANIEPVDRKLVQPYIEAVLSRNNYKVMSKDVLEKIIEKRKYQDTLSVKELAAEKAGLELLAALNISGTVNSRFSSKNDYLTWYRSESNIEIIRTDSGEIVDSFTDVSKGAGSQQTEILTNRQAYNESANTASKLIAQKLLERLDELVGNKFKREVVIEIRNLPDLKSFQWFVNLLRQIEWVEMPEATIDKRSFSPESSKVTISYKEKPYFLAHKLDNNKKLEVVETSYSQLLVIYN